MLSYNLEYYRAFYYVAKLGNITKAAKALYISQPAVTRSIQELEKNLKVPLFKRLVRGMELTSEGETLFKKVEAAFALLLSGEQEIQEHRQYIEGTIKIAATETPLYHFLLDKVENFQKQNPQVYFHVSGSSTNETITLLRDGLADFALAVSPLKPAGGLKIIAGKGFKDIFVAGSAYNELKSRVLSAEEIIRHPIISVEKGTSARVDIDLWFQEQGVFFEPAFSVRTSTTVLPFVERCLGIGILPDLFAKKSIDDGSIFEVKTTVPLHNREILIVHRDDASMSLICRKFLNHLLLDE